jgi:hypothetical protein
MQTFVGADERTQRKLKGTIADLRMDFTSTTASAPGGSDAANSPPGLLRVLCDAKTLACGDAYTSLSAAHLSDRETFPVEKRARRRFLKSTFLRPAISTRSSKTHNDTKWSRLKSSLYSATQGTDPSRALLLVSFSALLVSSPTAAAASARPSQGQTLPAS